MATLPERSTADKPRLEHQFLHPRRSTAKNAVSLPGNKRQKLEHPGVAALSISRAHTNGSGQDKSQTSSSDQSASKWFENVNKHVSQSLQGNAAFDDDEPPFFMANQNNYLPNQFPVSESSGKIFGAHSRLDSENEDLRGVIDDLTIENKKLKQILRTQHSQRASPSTESQDKLFEVRMHGLPPEKRRELEFLLKNFATSVHTSVPSMTQSNSGSHVSSSSLPGNKPRTDSGYVSNSNSAQTSLGNPKGNPKGDPKAMPSASKSSRDKSIRTYLHDIPDTLLPRQNPVILTERARMALVVRRLEQLFTGKSAAPGEHSQPLQQQEVSNMAARADAKNKKRKAEGTREAHILPPDSKVNFDIPDPVPDKRVQAFAKGPSGSDLPSQDCSVPVISRPSSPDQRPTRPLDLDIHRAQVATENLQYIRHLGISSPLVDQAGGEVKDAAWVYLNLIINMAQLHTINVTPQFVRRAIKKLSTKFELSKDGNKVRWAGGPDGTVFSKEEEKALETVDNTNESPHESTEDAGTGRSSKRSKTDSTSNAVVSNTASDGPTSGLETSSGSKQQVSTGATSNQQSSDPAKQSRVSSSFDYKPLIYRGSLRDTDEQFLQDSDSSQDSMSRDSSGLVHALSKSNLNQQRKSDEGLITFYNNPYFCSDYSGDKMPSNMLHDKNPVTGEVIGLPGEEAPVESPLRYGDACYFTPNFGPVPYKPRTDETLISLELAPLACAGEEETQPMELPCFGVGGVWPEDNFAIDTTVERLEASPSKTSTIQKVVPHTGTRVPAHFTYGVASVSRVDLIPSRLPPASYIFFTSSSSSGNQGLEESDDGSDDTSETSSEEEEEEEDIPPPPAFLQRVSGGSSGDTGDDFDDHDSSSVDMLALARAADPDRIAEQERQYMINEPGARAVAGSLAATVGASGSSPSRREIDSDAEVDSDMELDNDDDDSDEDK